MVVAEPSSSSFIHFFIGAFDNDDDDDDDELIGESPGLCLTTVTLALVTRRYLLAANAACLLTYYSLSESLVVPCSDTLVESTPRSPPAYHHHSPSPSVAGRDCLTGSGSGGPVVRRGGGAGGGSTVGRRAGRRRMEHGQSWWDGCRRCFCHDGHEMCALITCPTLRCINPVLRADSCCPSCPGKLSLLSSVGCRRRFCHDGHEMCALITCPTLRCTNPALRADSCCPACPGTVRLSRLGFSH